MNALGHCQASLDAQGNPIVTYVVRADDSPSRIAERILGAGMGYRWPELVAANPQKVRNGATFASLQIGERLRIPTSWLPASYLRRTCIETDPRYDRSFSLSLGDPRPSPNPPPIPNPIQPNPIPSTIPIYVPIYPSPGFTPQPPVGPTPTIPPAPQPIVVGGGTPPVVVNTPPAQSSSTPWIVGGIVALAALGAYLYSQQSSRRF